MAQVWIPSLMRDLTAGRDKVSVAGETVAEVIAGLDRLYPGIQERLCAEGRLRANLTLVIDGVPRPNRLRQRLAPSSEVVFLAAISGGQT